MSVLTAQAEELSLATGGRLVGTVFVGVNAQGHSEHTLSVGAPVLRDFKLKLLEVSSTPDLVRLQMTTLYPKGSLQLRSLDHLEQAIEHVLTSREVTKELQQLLARTMV